jgi:hypothetical protein
MRDLTSTEVAVISGGIVPILLGVLAFEWYEANNIKSAFDGFFDAMLEHQ